MLLKEVIQEEYQEPVSAHQQILSNNLLDQMSVSIWSEHPQFPP